jgi:hypothetical protein
MFTQLALVTALMLPGAPVPKSTPISGPAPRVVEIKPDQNGKILFSITRQEKQKLPIAVGNAIAPANGQAPAIREREITRNVSVQVELKDLKELVATTAAGKSVSIEDALKQISNGAVVVLSSDGKAVDPGFLRVFKDDTLVLSSPDLINIRAIGNTPVIGGGVIRPGLPIEGGVARPLPAVIPGDGIKVKPVQGGAIEVQILPAQPVPAVEKPAKNEK